MSLSCAVSHEETHTREHARAVTASNQGRSVRVDTSSTRTGINGYGTKEQWRKGTEEEGHARAGICMQQRSLLCELRMVRQCDCRVVKHALRGRRLAAPARDPRSQDGHALRECTAAPGHTLELGDAVFSITQLALCSKEDAEAKPTLHEM